MVVLSRDVEVVEGEEYGVQADVEFIHRAVEVDVTGLGLAVLITGFRVVVSAQMPQLAVSALVWVAVNVCPALTCSARLFAAGVSPFPGNRAATEIIASTGME